MYKKIFILTIINLLFLLISCKHNIDNTLSTKDYFISEISKYDSFNPDLINEYYNKYLENNNIIYSLNLINYPDFLNNDNIYQFIEHNKIILVNKNFILDENYIPKNLVPVTLPKINRKNEIMQITSSTHINATKLFNDAKKLHLNLVIYSSYRSYQKQINVYNTTLDKSYIAKAGTSEHQTGCALDIATIDSGLTNYFMDTKEYLFLEANAHKYGFIKRYPQNKEHITKYPHECWHFRYVGSDVAKIIYENDLCLEEYFYMYTELSLHQKE